MTRKSEQLQIRVTPAQKAALRRLADGAGEDLSTFVLNRALPEDGAAFSAVVRSLARADQPRFVLAELNDLLASLAPLQARTALADAPAELSELTPILQNYVAAMVEQTAGQLGIRSPSWTVEIPPLERPHFATPLSGLRLHLLGASPVPFKRRNIFVDSGVGARV